MPKKKISPKKRIGNKTIVELTDKKSWSRKLLLKLKLKRRN